MEQSHNYTKIPNVILDNLPNYTPIECKVMMLIARQTMGYDRAIHEFSVRYIGSKIGHRQPATIKAVNGLLDKNFIANSNTGDRGIRSLSITIDGLSPVTDDDQNRLQDVTTTGNRRLSDPVTDDYQNRSQNVTRYLLNKKLKQKIQTTSLPFSNFPMVELFVDMLPEELRSSSIAGLIKKAQKVHADDYIHSNSELTFECDLKIK